MAMVLVNYRLICNLLSDSETSLYVVAVGLTNLGTLVTGSALGSVLLRHLSPGRDDHSVTDFRILLTRVSILAFTTWLAFSVGSRLLLRAFPNLLGQPVDSVFWTLVFWTGFRCIITLLSECFRARNQFGKASLFGGLQEGPVANVAMTAYLVLVQGSSQSCSSVMTIHLCVTSIISAIAAFFLYQRLRESPHSSPVEPNTVLDFDEEGPVRVSNSSGATPTYLSLISESLKILVSQMALYGLLVFETLLVGRYCSDIQVGAWGAIRRLINAVSAPLMLINNAIPSFVAELLASDDRSRLEKLLRTTSTLALPPALGAMFVLWVAGDQILALFDPSFVLGTGPLLVLSFANVVFVAAGSAGLTLRMANRLGKATFVTLVAIVIYLAIAPMIIAKYQLWGAACTAAILVIILNIVTTLIVHSIFAIWCLPILNPFEVSNMTRQIYQSRKTQANKNTLS